MKTLLIQTYGLTLAIMAMASSVPCYAQQPTEAVNAPQPLTAGTSEEVRVADLGFTVKSLRVSGYTDSNVFSTATMALQIRNLGAKPVALDYNVGSISLTDEHGYEFHDNSGAPHSITGVGKATSNTASLDYVIEPGQSTGVQIQISRVAQRGQTVGNNYDLAAEFVSYQDLGEGKLKPIKTYPLSIVGLQRTPAIRGAIEGVGDQVKHGFSSIFGH